MLPGGKYGPMAQSPLALKVPVMPCVDISAEMTAPALSISDLWPEAKAGLYPPLDHYGLSAAAGGRRRVSSEHGAGCEPRYRREQS